MELKKLIQTDRQYYMNVFGDRFPVEFVRGKGAYLWDSTGKKYCDFLAGIAVNLFGYSDSGLVQTIQNQAANMLHTSNYFYVAPQAKAAKLLCKLSGMDKVFFSNSGAEAMEGAIKLARKYFYDKGQEKYEFITMKQSFHGRTLATLSATGQQHFQAPYHPLVPAFIHVPFNDLSAARDAVTKKTAGIIVEPIQGEGGVVPATSEFLQGIRDLCDEKGLLMIADEIQSGMGRTGTFLACQGYGVQPDIVTLAKALGGGIPIGAFAAKDSVAQAFAPSDHGSTFGGNHLATAAAEYVLTRIDQSDILNRVQQTGAYFQSSLEKLADQFPGQISGTRGKGLMQSLQLNGDIPAKKMLGKLLDRGFVVGSAGGNSLRFLPPYIVAEDQIDALYTCIADILKEIG